MEKAKKIILILIPLIIIGAVIWGVLKTFFKNKSGGATVEDPVKEAAGFIKYALNILNGKNGN